MLIALIIFSCNSVYKSQSNHCF